MAKEIDTAQQRFVGLIPELQTALSKAQNEAGTRFHILDRVLMEVLGWPNDQIEPELGVVDGFVDYTLQSLDARPQLIIEAKRVGKLTLGTASQKVSELVLGGSVLKPVQNAIRQAVGYASLKSVSLACVTDGRVWLFFQTNRRDGTDLLQGKGILFPSLASIAAEFPKFHDLLSPSGARDRLGLVQINRAEGIRAAYEEDQLTVSPPKEAKMLPRDALSNDASLLFKQFFAGISTDSDPDMLRACFVETAESRKADLELQKITQKLINTIETLDTGQSALLQDEVERAVATMQSEKILIIGNKGSGKSTFLTRFFSDVLTPSLLKRCLIVRVPLEEYPENDPQRVPSWAISRLRDQVELQMCVGESPTFDELRGVFWSEYRRLKEGALAPLYKKDADAFRIQFGQALEHMREREPEKYVRAFLERAVHNDKRLPVLIFDNTDQFPPAVQDAVYQLAHSLSVGTPVLNIVPITDRTVWRLAKSGALQSYPARSFYLPVPEAKKLLQKRIDYINAKLNADPDMARDYFSSRGFRVKLDNINRFAQAVERIFVSNDFVSGLIGRLSNFDIRRMLQVAERIFLSPEIKIDDVLRGSFGIAPGRGELLRIHRAIIKGEYDRFSDRENPFVCNLFWSDPAWPSSPLLAFHLLWTLKARLGQTKSDSVDARHWTANELCLFFEPAGAHPDQTMVIIGRLAARGLVEPLDPTLENITPGTRIAITESGLAHIDLVRTSEVYVEQMAMATGLNSRLTFDSIRNDRTVASAASFASLRRTFAEYLVTLDQQRLQIPTAKEYAGVLEARALVRELSTTNPTPRGNGAFTSTQSAPSRGIGKPFGGARWRR